MDWRASLLFSGGAFRSPFQGCLVLRITQGDASLALGWHRPPRWGFGSARFRNSIDLATVNSEVSKLQDAHSNDADRVVFIR